MDANTPISLQNDNPVVLQVEGLSVDFLRNGNYQTVVKNVSYRLFRGRTLGIVGESGSGKSVSSMAVMQLLPRPQSRVSSGKVLFTPSNGAAPIDLLQLSDKEMNDYRGSRISMVFQEPMTSLNPVQRCGAQVMEMLLLHEKVTREEARQRVLDLFNEVMLPRPEKIFDSYPHEISGGQKQRVMIAMALVCHPDILIADEPTTALDVTVQKTILELLRSLQQKYGIGIIFISHDLGVIAQIADDVAVMYKGEIVEQGTAKEVLLNPRHPYTKGLLACRPPLDVRPRRLPTVKDFLAQAAHPEEPMPREFSETVVPRVFDSEEQPLLSVRNLEVVYALKKNLFGKVLQELKAVDKVSFDIYKGETLGLVGESGCGKSTLGRAIMCLIDSHSGDVRFNGVSLRDLSSGELKKLRPKIQIVFQDPYSSLNPRIPVGDVILEPLKNYHIGKNYQERRTMVLELMQQVGLEPEWYGRYPHEFSGGQRQRVCIARALVLRPELVICDESVSALDVSVQAQVLNLLNELKEKYNYTYLFITHDLSVVKFLSDRIMVMEKGHIIEVGTADELYANPQKDYTKKLLSAIPRIS